ncbi:hypothetical protein PRIPAC_89871 [Pristionchus pacificus]|uniref:C2H2-type domain-containing protein n=1 Tax=Pristionchus pacificus TaxID=54126 RepID=A0A2A6B3L2_PRIPA|nr:hypothetical protein PRIPAC_89871 [Pristionchus pacificus]|eukprot:PDM60462.1 hypothetical protein PRIPAC_53440 [Pristionchus pacificus]
MPSVLDASNAASEPIKNEGSDRSRRYSCPLCPYATMTAKTIMKHIQMGHTKLKEFKCPNCSWSTAHEPHLIRHLKLHDNAGAQAPVAAVAPVSVEPEREMPRPQRRPLSSIGNERAVAVVPARSASFHHAPPRRLSAAVAEAPVTADKGRSRRSQFEAEKKEKEEKDSRKRKEPVPVVREAKQEEGNEEQNSEKSLAERVKRRKSGKEMKEEKEEEGKEVKKAEKETAVKVEQKGVETPSPVPRARRSFNVEKAEGREEERGLGERMDGKRRSRKSVEEKREEVVDEEPPQISDVLLEAKEVKIEEEEEEPVVVRKEVKRHGRKSAEKKKKEQKANVKEEEKEEEKRPIRHARLSVEKSAEGEKEGRGEDSSIRSSDARKRSRNSSASANEEKAGETGRKKRGRPSFAEVEERKSREEAEQRRSTATVEVKREAMEQTVDGERSGVKEEEDREDEMLDVSALDAAIAEAEANAARERVRPAMPAIERKREEGLSTRKRVHFAALPEKHHARHMPAKRRKRGEGEREGDAMRSSRAVRDLSSFFSSFDAPSSARSITSPDRSGRRATIIEAMKARASQLEQQDDEMAGEAAASEIKLPFSVIPFESPQRPQPIDEFESSDDEDTVAVPPPPVKPVRKTPAKARKRAGATVSPRSTVSSVEAGRKKVGKGVPAKSARETAARARAAATAARKREQARAARIRRLKREVARRLAKSADRCNVAARAVVEEEDRYWRTTTEVTPLEQTEWSGEQRLFSWPEIHNARRKLAIDVEPVRRRAEGGERRVETLHAISTSTYLARSVELKQRCEIDGIVKIVKSFDRARSPPLDWSYEEKETEDALHPTVPSEFVSGGRLRCL